MHFGLDVAGIVEQDIEDIVAFMVVRANDFRMHRDVIGHQGVGDDAFLEPKVFGRIPRVNRVDAGLKFLSIAAGVDRITKVVIPKDRQRCDRITDPIIGLFEGFETDKILRGAY